MSRLKGNRLFRSPQRRLPVAVLGLERRLSLQHVEPGVLIRTWTISALNRDLNRFNVWFAESCLSSTVIHTDNFWRLLQLEPGRRDANS
jgi:hypothetical protein